MSNDLGYPDNTEFTISAYDDNGNDLGTKKFDFEELFKYGKPVNSSRRVIKSTTGIISNSDPEFNEDFYDFLNETFLNDEGHVDDFDYDEYKIHCDQIARDWSTDGESDKMDYPLYKSLVKTYRRWLVDIQ